MSNIAIILAAGSGVRFGSEMPKQFAKLAGRHVIEHTIDVFEKHPGVDGIIIVTKDDHVDFIWGLSTSNQWKKLSKVIVGGEDRFGSTESAMNALSQAAPDTNILLHDAVRPLLNQSTISECITALQRFAAVDVVIPTADTIVQIHDNGCISNIPARAYMRRGQTPQAFRLETLREAYRKAASSGRRDFTCDCGVVRAMLPGVEVATVAGDESNIKITNPIDLYIAEKLFQAGFNASQTIVSELNLLKDMNIVIFGGSRGIGQSIRNIALIHGAHVHIASRSAGDVDVADLSSVQSFLSAVSKKSASIDAVINCAGVLIKKPFDLLDPEEIAQLIATNLTGAVNISLAAKPYLAKSKGTLINFTSSSYTRGRALYSVYSATKSAVVNLTQGLAEEWYSAGIRVNCINPERTLTPMRIANFGNEDPATLLKPETVANRTLSCVVSNQTGMIIDVKLQTSAP
jgi:2-C-methyl-D-erythritol 4-phosphate cytidylyltransferase